MITTDDLQGHWRRRWIKALGFEDTTTRVHWLQAGDHYVDLRIPQDQPRPDGARCLADLSDRALAQLGQAEGFAGSIDVVENVCTWQREINWQGPPDGNDIGKLWRHESGDLMEDGVEADYQEAWEKIPTDGLTAYPIVMRDAFGAVISGAETFLVGLGPKPPKKPATLPEMFESVFALGTWADGRGAITLCTDPFCIGGILTCRSGGFDLNIQDFHGAPVTMALDLFER
ncbi:MAG: hypothetical protein AAFQ64_16260 [Pseudomonadota bacterium]